MTSNVSKCINEHFEKVQAQGVEIGIEQGIEQGEKKKAIEIAKSLLDVLPIEVISEKTDLTIDEVKKLKNDN